MARSIGDLALSLAAIAGPDERAPLSYPVDAGSFMRAAAEPDVRGWRVAWSSDLGGLLPVDPEIVAAVERASSIFAQMGAHVRQDAPDFAGLLEAVLPSRGLLMVAHHAEKYEKHRDQLPASLVWNVELGLRLTSTEIARAEIARGRLRDRVREFFSRYDILLMPTEPVLPFPTDQDFPAEINGVKLDNPIHWFALCYAATVVGVPALSIPAGFSAMKLPIGMAILSASRREDKVLRAAAAYEQAQPWVQFVPPVLNAPHAQKRTIP
jgi:amidase